LEDCGHSIEREGLEQWLSTSQSGQISAKTCPKCKTTIRNCRRFGNLIRQHYKDVMTVKQLSFGNKANSDRMRDKWIRDINNDPKMERVFPSFHGQIREFLVNETTNRNGGKNMIPRNVRDFFYPSIIF